MLRRVLATIGGLLALAIIVAGVKIGPQLYAVTAGNHQHDTVAPALPADLKEPAILVFSKTNGFRHEEAIPAADKMLRELAAAHGWSVFSTENGAIFNARDLARFQAVVWNNASGDVLDEAQRAAFKAWLEQGGGYVGIHGAGGDRRYDWDWYVETLLGAQFIGHTLAPQFQSVTVHVEDKDHPATRSLDPAWTTTDELYSFAANPRAKGVRVLATLDEGTYQPLMRFPWPLSWLIGNRDLRMGDHPIAWSHCIGQGRALYAALGHVAAAYSDPNYRHLLDGALMWAAGLEGPRCENGAEQAESSPAP